MLDIFRVLNIIFIGISLFGPMVLDNLKVRKEDASLSASASLIKVID